MFKISPLYGIGITMKNMSSVAHNMFIYQNIIIVSVLSGTGTVTWKAVAPFHDRE